MPPARRTALEENRSVTLQLYPTLVGLAFLNVDESLRWVGPERNFPRTTLFTLSKLHKPSKVSTFSSKSKKTSPSRRRVVYHVMCNAANAESNRIHMKRCVMKWKEHALE
ncbi:hypothetical protein VNO80_15746 [Phaseolus coccineus]|uniref:Uncharacterized protein n=1 Tax=Phaseolus coccineus TaxID=3886 RepID=A0AAN9MKU1_PHACN